jgi:hypothetical protein
MTVWSGGPGGSCARRDWVVADRTGPALRGGLLIGVVLLIAVLIAGRVLLISVDSNLMHPFRTLVDLFEGADLVKQVELGRLVK